MPALILEPYGRAVVVKGDTRAVKDFLKEKGGRWNKGLVGWIFPGSKSSQLLADLRGNGSIVEDRTGAGGGGGAAAADPPASKAAKRPAPDAEQAAAAKKPKAAPAPDADGEVIVEITDKLRGTVSSFHGAVGVDIRKFYLDRGSGELRPTAKGVRLKTDEWEALRKAMPEVEAALAGQEAEVRLQATEEIMVTVKANEGGGGKSVDVRRFYTDRSDGELKPGKKGVFLSPLEWSGVKASAEEIGEALQKVGGGTSGGASAAAAPAPRKAATKDAPAASPKPAKASPTGSGGNHLREQLTDLLRGRDLQALSLKVVRGELEASLGMAKGALDSRREEIKGIVTDLLTRGIP